MSDDIGGHTGKPVLNGKVPRRDSDGWELFTDYFTATEDSQTQSPSKRQDGGEEQALASPMCLDDSLVLDSLEGSWMEGDSRAGSPVIHPEDVSAGGRSAHLYFVELMRRHEANVDADLHVPGNEDFNSVAENISPTKTDIQAIIAVPDSSATGLSDVASEELEMEARESCARSGAAQRDAQLECDDPLAFPLACFGTGEEKPDSLSPLRDRTQLYANFWRHPLFQTDEDISQLVRSSDTSEGNKWPKKTLTNISQVVVLDGPKIIWPHSDAGTSLTKPSCTEGELCKKLEWRELGAFRNSVSKSEPHKSPLRKKKLPLLLPAPKAERQPTERETENSGGMPLISRDLWSSGACSKSTQDPSARFAQWADNLGQDSGLKSTSEGPSGSSLLDRMSSKAGHHAQEGDGASGASAAKNPNSEGAHPAKGNSCREAPKSPEEGSLWHTLRCQREMPEISLSLTTRKNSALLIAPTELKQLPLQNQKASGEKTSFWSRPKSSALGSRLSGGSPTASAPTELNQQSLQNQKASGEKTSFWSRPKSSALGSQSSGSSHTAIAPTELNQQSLQNQKASGEKPSFWSRPKSSSLGSQVSEGSHTASPSTELNQHSLQNQGAFDEKTSFWSRPKSSALVSQVSEGLRSASAPFELNQQLLTNQKASGGKPSFWSRPKSSAFSSQSSEGSHTASAPTELNQQPLQNQKASGEKPSFWSRPKSSALGSQSLGSSRTASTPTELNEQPLQNQKASGEKTSFWSRPKSSAFGSQVSEGSHTAGPPTELDQHPMQNQAEFGKKTSFWSRPKSSALGSQASEAGHGVHQKSGVEPTATADFSCLSGKNGSDAGRNTLRNVPVDKSNGNTANSANMPAKRLWKRRPLLLPGPLKRPATCLEAAPSSALELLNPAQTMVNKFPKSPRKDDAQMEAKDTAAKMRKCDTQCETKDTSTQTAGPKDEPQETSAQTSFICVLGKHMMLGETGKHHLRGTFHMKQEELKFIDMSLQRANENTPVSFASYLTTNSVTVGRLRLGSNQEKPPAANNHSDTVLIPQDHSVKVATIGQGWLLLTKGSSFFVRRGVPFSLKNVGTATAEILYVLSQPC